jgi:hypothetical protein
MDILLILTFILIGYGLGSMYTTYKFMKLMKNTANEMGIDLEKEVEKRKEELASKEIRKLIIEQHHDTLYLFDRESNDFVCQAKTIEELATLAKQYKNVMQAVVVYDNKVFMFANGTSKEYTE